MTERTRLHIDWPTVAGAFFFMLIGGGFAGFGGWQLYTTYSFLGNATEVQAVVLDQNESCDDDGCTWWPELRYVAPDGSEITTETQFGSSAYGFSDGSEVKALHNPAYDYVRIPGGDNLWLLGGVFFALGNFAFWIGAWLMVTQTMWRVPAEEG